MPVITTQELTIYCYEGSSAELYALDNDINYVLIKSGSDSSSGICGDVDGDGSVTSADALSILRNSLGLEQYGKDKEKLADTDGDGTITSADALEVLRFTLGMATAGKVGNAA